jgi:hypothetical protein
MRPRLTWLVTAAVLPIFSCSGELLPGVHLAEARTSALVTAPSIVPRRDGTPVALNDGRLLYAGGRDSTGLVRNNVEIYDPLKNAWNAAAPLPAPMEWTMGALLKNGKVLIAAGRDSAGVFLARTSLYDPLTDTWTVGANMSRTRQEGSAIELDDGRVLVTGDGSSELFDPSTGTFTGTANMIVAREDFNIATLPSGKVLVTAGRITGTGTHVKSTEIYDPTLNTWSAAAPLPLITGAHSLVLLPNNRVFFSGTDLGQLYDESSNTWSPAPPGWSNQSATRLPNGKVVIAGGKGGLKPLSFYDATSNGVSDGGTLTFGREGHFDALLPTGRVLYVAGNNDAGVVQPNEIYDPFGAGSWSPVSNMGIARHDHAITRLLDGRVLVVGGFDGPYPSASVTATAEVYDPLTRSWAPTTPFPTANANINLVTLLNGEVLAFHFSGAWLYNPGAQTWRATGAMTVPRTLAAAALLPDGRVLAAGGADDFAMPAETSCEIYDPASETWQPTGSLAEGRVVTTAVLLPNGKVLVAGGQSGSAVVGSAELFDPATDRWTTVAPLGTATTDHGSVLLTDGKVLVYGGATILSGTVTLRSEVFDPDTNLWAATGSTLTAHCCEEPVLLPSGQVLASSGSPELYNPLSGIWKAAAGAATTGVNRTGMLLANGSALIVGGQNFGPPFAESQEFDEWAGAMELSGPVLDPLPRRVVRGNTFTVTGQRLTRNAEGSTGGYMGTATNRPLLLLERDGNGLRFFAPATNWSSTQFTALVPFDAQPGLYRAWAIVGGIYSGAKAIRIERAPSGAPLTLYSPTIFTKKPIRPCAGDSCGQPIVNPLTMRVGCDCSNVSAMPLVWLGLWSLWVTRRRHRLAMRETQFFHHPPRA